MRRFLSILAIGVLCTALSCPAVQARGRNNGGGNSHGTNSQQSSGNKSAGKKSVPALKSGNGNSKIKEHGAASTLRKDTKPQKQLPKTNSVTLPSRPGNAGAGNNNSGNHQATRPGNAGTGNNNSGNHQTTRPGGNANNNGGNHNNGGGHNGNNGGNHNKPAIPGNHNWSNGNNHNSHGNRPGFGPGQHKPDRPTHVSHIPQHRPPRPMMMKPRPFVRPLPPHAFRPAPRAPRFGTILGIALGSAINASLNYLLNGGYYVSGYTSNAVYVDDVMMLNMLWPSTTLMYNNGNLYGSEFIYDTPYYDTARYYSTYNILVNSYGAPVSRRSLPGGGMECGWFGFDNRFVTLQFVSGVAVDGVRRYYTTLSYGW